ncbi:MAG: cellulase family glycosylhydrolase [Armatimonadota bacterium]|nr:cellulase family glycosylhydrolase [Armatimonadota bacterium]
MMRHPLRSIVMLVCTAAVPAFAAPQPPGLTVREGNLIRNGKPYRAIGVNYCDLFQSLIADGEATRTLDGLRFLGEKRIPFVRFWACGFWPSDWDLYFRDKKEWFRRLDRVVHTAEAAGVGLIPSLFWRTQTYPDLFDEYNDQWGDPSSKTRRFMAEYVREVVTRYADSPAIWGWEFANEMNLGCNLPNGMQFLGLRIPHLKVDLPRHERNLMTYEVANAAFRAFAEEVRRYDRYRFVTTGNSAPRPSSWHNWREKSWATDTREQMAEVYRWLNPPPIDVVSIHFYPPYGKEPEFAGAVGIEAVLARHKELSNELKMPLFVGEFAASANPADGLTMEQYRAQQTRLLDAMLRTGVNLAAHWVFDYTADRKAPGLVRRGNEYAWILDQIAEYNARLR